MTKQRREELAELFADESGATDPGDREWVRLTAERVLLWVETTGQLSEIARHEVAELLRQHGIGSGMPLPRAPN